MDKRRRISPIIIAIIVIVAIAAVGIGYIVTRGAAPSGDIETATSLSFKVDMTIMDTQSTMIFKAKDIESPNIKFRIDGTLIGEEFKLIIYTGEEKAWMWMSLTGWQDISATMQPYLEQYQAQFDAYKEELSDWTGGDYTYTDPTTGATVRIYDVVINPDLPDTLFQID